MQSFGDYTVLASHEFPECSLRVLRMEPGQEVAAHHHATCVQSYVSLEGVAEVRVDDVYRRLERGEAVRVPARTVHGVRPLNGPAVVLSVSIPPLHADDHIPDAGRGRREPVVRGEV